MGTRNVEKMNENVYVPFVSRVWRWRKGGEGAGRGSVGAGVGLAVDVFLPFPEEYFFACDTAYLAMLCDFCFWLICGFGGPFKGVLGR